MAANGLAIFNNPLILGKILANFGRNELLNVRLVSKTFDDECVRLFTKQNYGRWVDGTKYFQNIQNLLKESRHTKLLIEKIKMKHTDQDLESHAQFVEMITSNAEHVKILQFKYYPFVDLIPILNVSSNLVELRWTFCVDDQPDDTKLFEKMPFNLKNLSSLELSISSYDGATETKKTSVDAFIMKIITGSDKLTMLSIETIQLAQFLKPILEDPEVSKKLMSLKILHVNDGLGSDSTESAAKQIAEENDRELIKLLFLVRNSIENLYISNSIWNGLSTQWPKMPNLTTISLRQNLKVPDISQMPSKSQAPKLKLLILGHSEYTDCMWRQGVKNSWTRQFELNKEIKYFKERQQRNRKDNEKALTVVLTTVYYERNWSAGVLKLMTDLNVEHLFLNSRNLDNGRFLLECIHCIPSLTRFVLRTEHNEDIKVLDIPIKL